MKIFITNCVLMTGLALLTHGLWLAWPPLSFIVAGGLLMVAAVKLGSGK